MKNLRFIKVFMIVCTMLQIICFNFTVFAGTVDDVRELLGRQRLDKSFTTGEIKEITTKYMEVERHNLYAKLNMLGDKIDVTSAVEATRLNLISKIEQKQNELVVAYKSCASVDKVLELSTSLSSLIVEKEKLREEGIDIKIDFENNSWTSDYKKVQLALKGISSDYEIGDVGSDLKSPLNSNFLITSPFGARVNPLKPSQIEVHKGLDLAAITDEPVMSLWPGVVLSSHYSSSGGNMVEIMHGNKLKTRYMHMNSLNVVAGQSVKQYDVIGLAGSTGWSTGTHLHFEVYVDGVIADPVLLFGNKGLNELKQWVSLHPYELKNSEDTISKGKNNVTKKKVIVKEKKRGFFVAVPNDYVHDVSNQTTKTTSNNTGTNLILDDGYTAPNPGILITVDEYFEQD